MGGHLDGDLLVGGGAEEAELRVAAAAVGVGAAEGVGQIHAAAQAPEELQARGKPHDARDLDHGRHEHVDRRRVQVAPRSELAVHVRREPPQDRVVHLPPPPPVDPRPPPGPPLPP